jgi:hypothetical protein
MMPDQTDPAYHTTFGRQTVKTVPEHTTAFSMPRSAAIAKSENSPIIGIDGVLKESSIIKIH